MRRLALVLAFAGACGHGNAEKRGTSEETGIATHAALASDDEFAPTYGKADLEKALIAERAAEASGERKVADLETRNDDDALIMARADLAVRGRFIASLEACEASSRTCPPRLDEPTWTYDWRSDQPADPKLDTPLRFDAETWPKVAAELFGRACACRTITCVDSMDVALNQLETRPMKDVQGDEAATISVVRARQCLFRLRGRTATPVAHADE